MTVEEQAKQHGMRPEDMIAPEAVAEAMLALVQDDKHKGGDRLEVTRDGTRLLGTWNIDPPSDTGTTEPIPERYALYASLILQQLQK